MPASGFYSGNAQTLLTALVPRTNWQQAAQQKQAELQYANINEARARQDATELEQGIQQQMQTIQAIKATPAEAPDRPLIENFLNNELKNALTTVKENYGGDFKKFLQTEGKTFTDQMKTNYVNSPVYARVERNKLEMDLARKALAENKSLIGTIDPNTGKYVSADEEILKFRNGESTGFTFRGAYDPSKANAYEEFAKIYNPNGSKYERSPVAEEDKLAYAQSNLGNMAGVDHYYQNLQGKKIYYKSDPIEDKTLFDLNVAGKQMSLAEQKSQIAKNNAAAAKDLADAQGEAAKPVPQSYFQRTFSSSVADTPISYFNPTSPKANAIIPGLGVKVGDLATTIAGQSSLNMRKYPNSEATELANESVGITETTRQGKKVYDGQLPGLLKTNGESEYVDLRKVKHQVLNSDSYIYVDSAEDAARVAEGRDVPKRAWKYYEVAIGENTGKSLGLDNSKLKNLGTAENPKMRYVLKGFTPVKEFVADGNIDITLSKKQGGQKQTNEIFNATPAPQPQVFNWD